MDWFLTEGGMGSSGQFWQLRRNKNEISQKRVRVVAVDGLEIRKSWRNRFREFVEFVFKEVGGVGKSGSEKL
jgi:hypothetical protein